MNLQVIDLTKGHMNVNHLNYIVKQIHCLKYLKEHDIFCQGSQYKVTHCLNHNENESWINKAKTCSPVISLVTH